MHNISITLKSLKYRHLTLYLKSPPHHHTHTHTHREVVLSPKHQHTSTLTPLSLVKSGPQHRSLSLCLSGMHTSLPSLSRSPAISLTQAHALCRVYISHTHKTSPPNVYLPSYVVLAQSPHTPPPLQNKHTLSPCAPLSSFYLSHMRTRPSSFPIYIYVMTLSIAP